LKVFFIFIVLYLVLEIGLGVEGRVITLVHSLAAEYDLISAVVIVAILAGDVVLPVPASPVMIMSGALFGGAVGAVLSTLGSSLGAWINFELARKYGRLLISEHSELNHAFQKKPGALMVMLSRAIPIVMETVNTTAGLSRMSRKTFLLSIVAGITPLAFLYAYSGEFHHGTPAVYWVLGLGFFVPFLVWKLGFKGSFR